MAALAVVVGVVLLVGVGAGLALCPPLASPMPLLLRLGRGTRRWWVLGLAVAVVFWVGVLAGLSGSESHPFVFLVLAASAVLPLLGCVWAWARARSFS